MTDMEIAKAIAHLGGVKHYGFGKLSSFTESVNEIGLVEIEFSVNNPNLYYASLSAKGYDFVEEHT